MFNPQRVPLSVLSLGAFLTTSQNIICPCHSCQTRVSVDSNLPFKALPPPLRSVYLRGNHTNQSWTQRHQLIFFLHIAAHRQTFRFLWMLVTPPCSHPVLVMNLLVTFYFFIFILSFLCQDNHKRRAVPHHLLWQLPTVWRETKSRKKESLALWTDRDGLHWIREI